jgi:HPt (histidine-containing phosphotransfer) domain-containing protein
MLKISGTVSEDVLRGYYKERKKFVEKVGLVGQNFIEIHELSQLTRISFRAYKYIKEEKEDAPEELKPMAFFSVHPPFILKIFQMIWAKRSLGPSFSENIRTYREAFIRGMNMIYESGAFSFAEKNRIPGREWYIENPLYRESLQLLSDDLFYAEAKGRLSREEEYRRRDIWSNMLESLPSLRKGFTLILALKEDFPQEDIEKILSPQWQKILMDNYCAKLIILTNQDNTAVSVNQLLTLSSLSFRVERRFSETIERLFPREQNRWLKEKIHSSREEDNTESIERLEDYILSLDIKKNNMGQLISSEMLEDRDCLKPVYQSVNLFFTQVQDEYLRIHLRWEELLHRTKEAQLQRGLYELLYRDRSKILTIEQAVEELTELFNEVMEQGRSSCFLPHPDAYYCSLSAEKHRPSLKGIIIPKSVIHFLDKEHNRMFLLKDFDTKLDKKQRLTLGPFLRSFMQSQGIARLLLLPLLDEKNPKAYLMMDFKDDYSRESDYIYHLLNQQVYLLKKHFNMDKEPTGELPPLDIEEALSEYDNDKKFFKGVLGHFIEALPGQLDLISLAVKKLDHQQITRECHKIKGGAANLFAKDLQKASRLMEEAGQQMNQETYSEVSKELISQGERLRAWYQTQWP